jgi:cytochrome bd ubiquinol oxidase subunit I
MMNALALSRIQFGFTIGYHILWPTFTIGIASFVALLSFLWWDTGRPVYGALMRFWIRIFALGFGMGVVTGIVLSYEMGTNWSGFSRAVNNVLGPFIMYEVMTAFFLEAGFIGIVLFGEKRVGRGLHFFACLMVAVGTLCSARHGSSPPTVGCRPPPGIPLIFRASSTSPTGGAHSSTRPFRSASRTWSAPAT